LPMLRLLEALERWLGKHKALVLALLVGVAVLGAGVGWRYWRYTQNSPEFCATCHMMQESFRSWQRSRHWDVRCQQCHQMGAVELNRLLVAYVLRGATAPQRQLHGRAAPWQACRGCHVQDIQQGSISLRRSYGHARHVFMENLGCQRCHSGSMHGFTPNQEACRRCHRDRLVHGLGMEGLQCLNCHSYGEEAPKMVSSGRCRDCHQGLPTQGVMAQLNCFDCHYPHGRISPRSQDCLRACHGNEVEVGQHRRHIQQVGLQCLSCHKAHHWRIGQRQARGLCDRCHPMKDPRSFIY